MKKGADILKEILELTGETINSLANSIKLPRSQNLYDIEKGKVKKISSELSEKIVLAFPHINRDYLLTGVGNILTENSNHSPPSYQEKRLQEKNSTKKKGIPFYDATAIGGNTETDMQPITEPSGTIDIGDLLRDSESAIRIFGSSMTPNYPSGCVVGLIRQRDKTIEPGEIYVIETRDRRVLKRLFYKDDDSLSQFFTCYSDNTMLFETGGRKGKLAYPPYDIHREDIINIYIVTGVIKRNANSLIINKN